MRVIGIIPARYASKRFPGKALADIQGKPMFWHVWNQAKQCRLLDDVVLATDSSEIYTKANELIVPVILTSQLHRTGSDRVFEAAEWMFLDDEDIVVNIQGDEPLIHPDLIDEIVWPLITGTPLVVTAAYDGSSRDLNRVKVLRNEHGDAVCFSRANISDLIHIGVYTFRMKTLRKFAGFPTGKWEALENLEQLRFMENDIPVRVIMTKHKGHSVDTAGDWFKVIRIMEEKNDHRETL